MERVRAVSHVARYRYQNDPKRHILSRSSVAPDAALGADIRWYVMTQPEIISLPPPDCLSQTSVHQIEDRGTIQRELWALGVLRIEPDHSSAVVKEDFELTTGVQWVIKDSFFKGQINCNLFFSIYKSWTRLLEGRRSNRQHVVKTEKGLI